jgi:hypothetical protein
VIETVGGDENLTTTGNWKVIVGEAQDGKTVRRCGLGKRNDKDERLIEFRVQNGFIITNAI